MSSLREKIIAIANEASHEVIDRLESDGEASNQRKILAICQQMVAKNKMPETARVAEIMGLTPRALYNRYPEIPRIWRAALKQIQDIRTDEPHSLDDMLAMTFPSHDEGTRALLKEYQRYLKECFNQLHSMKRRMRTSVPEYVNHVPADLGHAIDELGEWQKRMGNSMFQLDERGLKVSRRTPVGTTIMDSHLFELMKRLVEGYQAARDAQKLSEN